MGMGREMLTGAERRGRRRRGHLISSRAEAASTRFAVRVRSRGEGEPGEGAPI